MSAVGYMKQVFERYNESGLMINRDAMVEAVADKGYSLQVAREAFDTVLNDVDVDHYMMVDKINNEELDNPYE